MCAHVKKIRFEQVDFQTGECAITNEFISITLENSCLCALHLFFSCTLSALFQFSFFLKLQAVYCMSLAVCQVRARFPVVD